MIELSVIICSHNPRRDYLRRVLDALRDQSLSKDRWELLLVDNGSQNALAEEWDLTWHPHAVTSGKIGCGLSFARVRGFRESKSEVIIYVDDDNVLNSNYLRFAEQTMAEDASLGACGGRVLAEYEGSPPEWFSRITVSPACCDLGPQTKHFSWIGLDRSQRMVPARRTKRGRDCPSARGISALHRRLPDQARCSGFEVRDD